jgi:hypothetical protein
MMRRQNSGGNLNWYMPVEVSFSWIYFSVKQRGDASMEGYLYDNKDVSVDFLNGVWRKRLKKDEKCDGARTLFRREERLTRASA